MEMPFVCQEEDDNFEFVCLLKWVCTLAKIVSNSQVLAYCSFTSYKNNSSRVLFLYTEHHLYFLTSQQSDFSTCLSIRQERNVSISKSSRWWPRYLVERKRRSFRNIHLCVVKTKIVQTNCARERGLDFIQMIVKWKYWKLLAINMQLP